MLVVLYAINVFITFTLSQLGMSVHWWQERAREPHWRRKLAINGVGCSFTALILMLTVTLKFDEGGWVTVVITGALVVLCYLVRHHYRYITRRSNNSRPTSCRKSSRSRKVRPNNTTPKRQPRSCWSTASTAWVWPPC